MKKTALIALTVSFIIASATPVLAVPVVPLPCEVKCTWWTPCMARCMSGPEVWTCGGWGVCDGLWATEAAEAVKGEELVCVAEEPLPEQVEIVSHDEIEAEVTMAE